MVRIHPDPPTDARHRIERNLGAIAQLGERLLCKQEVTGSIPVISTKKKFYTGFKIRQIRSLTIYRVREVGIFAFGLSY